MDGNAAAAQERNRMLFRVAPGLEVLAGYQREWLKHDLIAGVSVNRPKANRRAHSCAHLPPEEEIYLHTRPFEDRFGASREKHRTTCCPMIMTGIKLTRTFHYEGLAEPHYPHANRRSFLVDVSKRSVAKSR